MTKIEVLDLIAKHTREILPELHQYQFNASDRLVDLGANSVDRSEIIAMTLESLSLNIRLVEVARAQNIGELAGILHSALGAPASWQS